MEQIQWKKQLTEGRRRLRNALIAVFVLTGLVVTGTVTFMNVYKGKIFPGVTVGGINAGGMTKQELEYQLSEAVERVLNAPWIFELNGESVEIMASASSLGDPDISRGYVRYDIENTAEMVMAWGRSGNFWIDGWQIARAQAIPHTQNMIAEIRLDMIRRTLDELFQKQIKMPQNARPVWNGSAWEIEDGEPGLVLLADRQLSDLAIDLYALRPPDRMVLALQYWDSDIGGADVEKILHQLKGLDAIAAVTLEVFGELYEISGDEVRRWVIVQKDAQGKGYAMFDAAAAAASYQPIADRFTEPAMDAKFDIQDGRVTAFQGSREGRVPNQEKTAERIWHDVAEIGRPTSTIEWDVVLPTVTTGSINNLGITELIGTGESVFTGSSRNRITNITVGAAALNGRLIEPDQEFSLVEALGDIDAVNGYVPEIVIKGDRTQPEFGGGLCQIGTTLFRAALGTGLPITERQNHSFRVRYYEPAGTDATIYGPHPDLRFVNDTGNFILLQTRIEGSRAVFEVWGTSDGRTVKRTEPKIYNFVSPPPTKLIETTDLAPGEKKCTEKAVTGATAEFDYQVTYPNGEIKERTFKSYYRPWQEVCLIGVAGTSTEETLNVLEST